MLRVACLAAALAMGSAAQACGYCVEDKIASVYDHALVTQALAQRRQIVFFHIDGPLVPGESSRRWLLEAASSMAGVDKGGVRVAVDTLTIAIAFDPGRTSLPAMQNGLERKLTAKRLSLMPLRVMDRPADLKTVSRRQ